MAKLPNLEHRFYVYLLFRPWNGVPCYVGKGKDRRVHYHSSVGEKHTNKHLANIFKRVGGTLPFVILFSTDDELEAFHWEEKFIRSIGRADLGEGPLCNLTFGGEGPTGRVRSESERKQISASMRNLCAEMPESARIARMSAAIEAAAEANRTRFSSMSLAEKENFAAVCSERLQKYLSGLSREEKLARMAPAHAQMAALTPVEREKQMAPARAASSAGLKAFHAAMSPEEKDKWSKKSSRDLTAFLDTLTPEERKARTASARAVFEKASSDELKLLMRPAQTARDEYWANVSPEQKAAHMAKVQAGQKAYWERRRAQKALEEQNGG